MLGDKIKELRQARNMSQVDLGKKIGVSKQSVSNWENENIQPSIDMLIRIADVFSVTCYYLLGLDSKKIIEVKNLTVEEIAHIQQIINDMVELKKGSSK